MTSIFRLLSAGISFTASGFSPRNRQVEVHFLSNNASIDSKPWVSILIGKNGVGKSRLLAAICDTFDQVEKRRARTRNNSHWTLSLTYQADNDYCTISIDANGALRASVNGNEVEAGNVRLPSRIIALTTTPFDKFRVTRSPRDWRVPSSASESRYSYLGLRDATGRASPTATIYRAVENLFEASRAAYSRRLHVADVFRFLGYAPRIKVVYEFDYHTSVIHEVAAGESRDQLNLQDRPTHPRRLLAQMVERDPDVLSRLEVIAKEALQRSGAARHFALQADFESGSSDDDFFRRVQLLRKAGLVRLKAVELQKISDGATIDLRHASSGELGIVTGFLGMASVIEDGSLVFIDEPEISLHPEWQARYIDLLLATFERFKGCHFVLATHSPLILSDISRDNSSVVFLDPGAGEVESAETYSGQSADHLLVTAFRSPGSNNLYLKQEIVKALRLAADGKTGTSEFRDTVLALTALLPNLDTDSAVHRLISELSAVGTKAP